MSILSMLFRKEEQSGKSYVRTWTEKRQREFLSSNELSPENLFALMMLFISSFLGKDMRDNIPSEWKGSILDIGEHYCGDSTLFELGCYLYFRLDLWLYQNKPHRRKEISTIFTDGFIELFTLAFKNTDVSSLFNQRISQYAELVRTGADEETYHFYLDQLIVRTRDNRLPKSYHFKHEEPLMVTDGFEHVILKIAITAWEKGMISGMLKSIADYCDSTE